MKNVIILLLSISVLISCSDEYIDNNTISDSLNYQSVYAEKSKDDYDKNVKKIAKGFSKLLESKQNREIIKEHLLKKVDGDFDFLIKDFENVLVDNKLNFLDIIINSSVSDEKDKLKSAKELKNYIFDFKKIQISMPIKCIDWETENFRPKVGYLTSDYIESQDYIDVYTQDSKLEKISNLIVPTEPVMIISINERSDENGVINNNYSISASAFISNMAIPSNLSLISTTNGILLNWTYNGDANSEYIIVERSNGSGFQVITSFPNQQNQYLDQKSLSYGNTYYYRIKVFSTLNGYSNYSNIAYINYQQSLTKPANFKIKNTWPNLMELNWTNTLANISGLSIKIDRFNYGVSTNWENVATLPLSTNSFFDNTLSTTNYPLNKFKYRIYYSDQSLSESEKIFDGDYNSKRKRGDPIVITHILIPKLADIEPWPGGQPEFLFSVFTMDSLNNNPINVKDKLFYRPASSQLVGGSTYSNSLYNTNFSILSNWDKDFFKSIMTVHVLEEDPNTFSSEINIKIGVKKALKTPLGDISITMADSTHFTIKNVNEDLKYEYIEYWEEPANIKTFSYGIKLRFNNTTTTGSVNM